MAGLEQLQKVPPFLIKLYEILSAPACDGLICWNGPGDTFRIVDRLKFAQVIRGVYPLMLGYSPALKKLVHTHLHNTSVFFQDVLPLYFKHDNLRSFIRQLNTYGFQRVPNLAGCAPCYHRRCISSCSHKTNPTQARKSSRFCPPYVHAQWGKKSQRNQAWQSDQEAGLHSIQFDSIK